MKLSELVNNAMEKADQGLLNPLSTGINTLDMFQAAWYPGELCIVAGHPLMGKTALVMSFVRSLVKRNVPVGLLRNTDYDDVVYMARIVRAIKEECVTDRLKENISFLRSVKDIDDIKLYIGFEPKLTLDYIKSQARELKEKHNIKCLFIESLQSIYLSDSSHEITNEDMSCICRELKALALSLNMAIIISSDLNKVPDDREVDEVGYPQLSDLKGHSDMKEYADLIILIYRPEYYQIMVDECGNDLKGTARLVIAKNKYSAVGDFKCIYDEEKCLFYDLFHDSEDEKEKILENEAVKFLTDTFGLEEIDDDPPF